MHRRDARIYTTEMSGMKSELPLPGRSFESLQALFDYDPEVPLDIEETVIEQRDGISIHDVHYNAAPGIRFNAYLVVPPKAGRFAGIIYVHPGPGSRATFRDESLMLARWGAVSLLIDAPWTEKGGEAWGRTLADPENAVQEHIRTVVGLRRGLDLLEARPDVDPNRIGYVGHSFGALVGGVLSGVEKRVKAYVLMAGTGSFTDVAVLNMPSLAGEALERYRRTLAPIDPGNYIGHAAPSAVLFQFGLRDDLFTREKSLEFFEKASEPRSMEWYDAGHYLNDEAREDRIAWLRARLSLHAER